MVFISYIHQAVFSIQIRLRSKLQLNFMVKRLSLQIVINIKVVKKFNFNMMLNMYDNIKLTRLAKNQE